MRPLIVADSLVAAGEVLAALRRDGWTSVDADGLPGKPWDLADRKLVISCSVDGSEERSNALVVAARGAAVVAVTHPSTPELAMFVDELSRLGPVEFASQSSSSSLTVEQRQLLRLLASGETLGAAARRLSLSRRTADRRVAEARAALGASSTAQAVLAFRASEETRRGPGLPRV